ncbi:MAG: YHYH domain-containing protein [Thermodesulfovibrionales bacterium]|nr:YHYH domain-containing protein [Thermodesulfovibrionales bacterium]
MTSDILFVYTLSMKKVVIFYIILLFPLCAYAHPGKTDYRGGHKCWKNCSEWELRYGEYHLHDKDWKPIRLDKKGVPIGPLQPYPVPAPESPKQGLSAEHSEQTEITSFTEERIHEVPKTDKKVITEYNRIVTVYEEGILPLNVIFLLILVLALLIILICIRKKRERN